MITLNTNINYEHLDSKYDLSKIFWSENVVFRLHLIKILDFQYESNLLSRLNLVLGTILTIVLGKKTPGNIIKTPELSRFKDDFTRKRDSFP